MRSSILTLSLVVTALITTGCGRAGEGLFGSTESSSSAAPGQKLLVANNLMALDKATYASPANGGLITKLFIQPRGLMSIPDDQTTGCGQAGLGALGIDTYLSHPEWGFEQPLLLTEVFVPTRNFAQGFPLVNATGGILPVRSYFVLDGKGYFQLAAGEPEGDYQFAMIADDGARLLLDTGAGLTMAIDDQKPAGPNGGCLEQTQSAHFSCTTAWGDQSAAKIRTVHLKPGQRIPIEMQYWQGPGFGLSMMAFYKRVDPTKPLDPVCGNELGYGAGEASLVNVLKTWTPVGQGNLTN